MKNIFKRTTPVRNMVAKVNQSLLDLTPRTVPQFRPESQEGSKLSSPELTLEDAIHHCKTVFNINTTKTGIGWDNDTNFSTVRTIVDRIIEKKACFAAEGREFLIDSAMDLVLRFYRSHWCSKRSSDGPKNSAKMANKPSEPTVAVLSTNSDHSSSTSPSPVLQNLAFEMRADPTLIAGVAPASLASKIASSLTVSDAGPSCLLIVAIRAATFATPSETLDPGRLRRRLSQELLSPPALESLQPPVLGL